MTSSSSTIPPAILAQQTPPARMVQTYQALVVMGLQEEFLNKEKSTAVNMSSGFLEKIIKLIPKFRDRAGYLIWIPTETAEIERLPKTPKDVDKFIGILRNKEQAEWPSEREAPAFHPDAQSVLNKDLDTVMSAPYWTNDTVQNFTDTMYASVITKIFICGCITDSSIYLLMLEAAKKGWDVIIIEDCLGFYDKDKKRHKLTLKHMMEKLFVEGITSKEMEDDLDRAVEMEGVMTEGELGDMLDTLLSSPAGKGKGSSEIAGIEEVKMGGGKGKINLGEEPRIHTEDEKLEASKIDGGAPAEESQQFPADEDHATIKDAAPPQSSDDKPQNVLEILKEQGHTEKKLSA